MNGPVMSTVSVKGLIFWPLGEIPCAHHEVVPIAGCVNLVIHGELTSVYFSAGRQHDTLKLNDPIAVSVIVEKIAAMMNRFINSEGKVGTGNPVSMVYLSPELCKQYILHDQDGRVVGRPNENSNDESRMGHMVGVDYN